MRAAITAAALLLLLAAAPAARAQRDIGALEAEPGLEIGGRLGALWTLRDAADRPANELRVSAARLALTWTQWKLVEAAISVEAAHLLDGDFAILRDLYVRVQPLRWLGARAGQFKKPFSRNELRSRWKYPLVDRGLGNGYLVEHLGYGDRDVGVQLEGRLWKRAKLDYAIGLFNGRGPNTAELSLSGAKDVAARIEAAPADWIAFGASGSVKILDRGDLRGLVDADALAAHGAENADAHPLGYSAADFAADHARIAGAHWAGGADVALALGDLRLAGEAILADDWWFEDYPWAWGFLAMASYRIRLGSLPLWIEPAVRGEGLTILSSWSEWQARLWQLAPGLNLLIGDHVKLMIDGELVFAERSAQSEDRCADCAGLWPNEWPGDLADSKKLLVQLLFGV